MWNHQNPDNRQLPKTTNNGSHLPRVALMIGGGMEFFRGRSVKAEFTFPAQTGLSATWGHD